MLESSEFFPSGGPFGEFVSAAIKAALSARPRLGFEVRDGPSPGSERCLALTSTCGRTLLLSFFDDEFTVEFDTWHSHYDTLEEALGVIDAICADRHVVLSAFVEQRWRFSQLAPATDEAWLDFITDPCPRDPPSHFFSNSWSGSSDRQYVWK